MAPESVAFGLTATAWTAINAVATTAYFLLMIGATVVLVSQLVELRKARQLEINTRILETIMAVLKEVQADAASESTGSTPATS
jgi:hypothetical protein